MLYAQACFCSKCDDGFLQFLGQKIALWSLLLGGITTRGLGGAIYI